MGNVPPWVIGLVLGRMERDSVEVGDEESRDELGEGGNGEEEEGGGDREEAGSEGAKVDWFG